METLQKSKKPTRHAYRTAAARKPKTLEAFLQWERPEGAYKYEWVRGALEKTEYMMKNTELVIVRNIKRAFYTTAFFQQGGELFAEVDVKLNEEVVRIPDLAAFDEQQISAAGKGEYPIPAFAIEIISPNEKGPKIEQKALDYFAAGVQVLWQVYPSVRMVRVLTSPRDVQVCFEQDACSAAPALPDMQIAVEVLLGND